MHINGFKINIEIEDLHIRIKDLRGHIMAQVTGTFTVTVNPAGPPPNPLALTPPGGSLPSETVGVPVTDAVTTISGGQAPYTLAITAGALPDGVSLAQAQNPDGSVLISLSGAPTAPGAFSFDLQVTDAGGASATGSFTRG
jgi:hypothetical protein